RVRQVRGRDAGREWPHFNLRGQGHDPHLPTLGNGRVPAPTAGTGTSGPRRRYGSAATTTRLRPPRLASYSASSARLNSASNPSSGRCRATPTLTVTGAGTPDPKAWLSTALRRSSASAAA